LHHSIQFEAFGDVLLSPNLNPTPFIYQLFMAQQKLRTYITNALHTEGIKVTLGQAGILFLLRKDNGQTMTELSKTLGVKNATLTGLIDRLQSLRLKSLCI
jgi:DNA-binding MarR family transcriptional regulator